MAKKSKTQRAKASAARQQRKAARENVEEVSSQQPSSEEKEEKPRKLTLRKSSSDATPSKSDKDSSSSAKSIKKSEAKTKKPGKIVQFFRDVKAEMKRVTWPTRTDVLRWSGVVIVALLFFGIFTAFLDNIIITPILVWISGLGM